MLYKCLVSCLVLFLNNFLQSLTVDLWISLLMEKWKHPLEPLTQRQPPTPVMMAIISLEMLLECVSLMQRGVVVNQPVLVS